MTAARPTRLVLTAALLLTALGALLPADAQGAGKAVRIGRLSPLSAETDSPNLEAFRKGLRERAWERAGWTRRRAAGRGGGEHDGRANRSRTYAAFNARDIDAVLGTMHPDVI